MRQWNIEFAPAARRDLRSITGYIANTLQEPETAQRLYRRIRQAINALSELPERCPVYQQEPWRSRGVRKLLIGNFMVLYHTEEERNVVFVMRIVYARQNLSGVLTEVP